MINYLEVKNKEESYPKVQEETDDSKRDRQEKRQPINVP